MQLTGKIIRVMPPRTGIASSGNEWMTQEYVIEYQDGQYKKKCVFDIFGRDKIEQYNLQPGMACTVSLDIDAHEFNGRFFSDIRAWKVEMFGGGNNGNYQQRGQYQSRGQQQGQGQYQPRQQQPQQQYQATGPDNGGVDPNDLPIPPGGPDEDFPF